MVDTIDPNVASKRWADSISFVPSRYVEGVQGAQNVIQKSIDAEDRYRQGLQDSFARNARVEGLNRTNDAEWKQKAINKGSRNILVGMNEGKSKQARAMAKIINVIRGVELPEKTNDLNTNIERVRIMAQALKDAKGTLKG